MSDNYYFSEQAGAVCRKARELASDLRHTAVDVEHLLVALLEAPEGTAGSLRDRAKVDTSGLREYLRGKLAGGPSRGPGAGAPSPYTDRLSRVLQRAQDLAYSRGHDYILIGHMLWAIADAEALGELGPGLERFRLTQDGLMTAAKHSLDPNRIYSASRDPETTYPGLENYGRDYTWRSRPDSSGMFVGRAGIMQRAVHALLGYIDIKPILLVGKTGVGKTEFVWELVGRLTEGDLAERARPRRVIRPDYEALTAGASNWAVVRQRLRSLLAVPEWHAGLIVIIDDLRELFHRLAGDDLDQTRSILNSPSARGKIRMLATLSERWSGWLASSGLDGDFDVSMLPPPSIEETATILRIRKHRLEQEHGVPIKDAALARAAELAGRHDSEHAMPDRAIRLVQEAATQVALSAEIGPPSLVDLRARVFNLELQRESLRQEKGPSIQERLTKVEKELENTVEGLNALDTKWNQQRGALRRARELEGQIWNLEAEQSELAHAQLKGGVEHGFQRLSELFSLLAKLKDDLERERARFRELSGADRLVKPDVDVEEIEWLVKNKWAGGDLVVGPSGQEIESLRDALCSAFDQPELDQMLRARMNMERKQWVGPGSLREVVSELILLVVRTGRLAELIRAARQANPGNPALREFSENHPHLVAP
jgi:ATP-dependent Clp protease ATP-binding subunit ClpB